MKPSGVYRTACPAEIFLGFRRRRQSIVRRNSHGREAEFGTNFFAPLLACRRTHLAGHVDLSIRKGAQQP